MTTETIIIALVGLAGPVIADLAKRWKLTEKAAVSVNGAVTIFLSMVLWAVDTGLDPALWREYFLIGLALTGGSSMAQNLHRRAAVTIQRAEALLHNAITRDLAAMKGTEPEEGARCPPTLPTPKAVERQRAEALLRDLAAMKGTEPEEGA